MKKTTFLLVLICTTLFYACKKDKTVNVNQVTVQLVYDSDASLSATSDVKVVMTAGGTGYEAYTNADGQATFSLPVGLYELSASDVRSNAGTKYIYNGSKSNVAITDTWDSGTIISLELTESKTSQLVIKEVYVGGVPTNDGTSVFNKDSYIILYNNSDIVANTGNLCIGAISPLNAHATNSFYDDNGVLLYANEGWIPLASGFWYFQNNIEIQPGEQIVVALYFAVNNTITYSKSINFDNAAYYATYDMTSPYINANYYTSPSASIPTSHYLKAYAFGSGNAWTPSILTPGIFIFDTKGTSPVNFGADATNLSNGSKKVPVEWVVDGIESFHLDKTTNKKRFLPSVDAGYVYHINKMGYSIYRNVDKEATEAISENNGKLVYSYSLGTTDVGGTTDPSSIDAEASAKNGARIIYKDTNNSTNDVHLRLKASLSNY